MSYEQLNQSKLFEILKEGNPNSLGRLLEIFQLVIDNKLSINNVYDLYQFEDDIVSMRVSNILKRLWRLDPLHVLTLIPLFLKDEKNLHNPTFRWTLAQIFKDLYVKLSDDEKFQFIQSISRNLTLGNDWIMLVQSMDALIFAKKKGHPIPSFSKALDVLSKDARKVVKNKAVALLKSLE
jgi:hypothetical protein